MNDGQRSFLKALLVTTVLTGTLVALLLATGLIDTVTDHQLLIEIRDLLRDIRDQR